MEIEKRNLGTKVWFEYHCWESPESGDAELWYHSHQQVEILAYANLDDCPPTFKERIEAGMALLYKVRFPDGFEWDVFEDELLDFPEEFQRPNPPER